MELRELVPTPRGLIWNGRGSPAARVGLRSASASSITVVEESTGTILGSVEEARALWTVHEGAVYLHRGDAHLVTRLDLDARVALVEPHAGGLLHPAPPRDRPAHRRTCSPGRSGARASACPTAGST